MKKTILLPLMLTGGLTMAAEMPIAPPAESSGVETTVTKISCSQDVAFVLIEKDGKETVYRESGPTSESTRTTWKDGGIEYRFSESVGLDADGKPEIKSRSMFKVVEKRDGNRLTIESEGQSVSWMLRDGVTWGTSGSKLKKDEFKSADTYEIHGNIKIQVASVENGKPAPAVMIETEYNVSSDKKMITYVARTPYVQDLENGMKIRYEKSEMTCLFETK